MPADPIRRRPKNLLLRAVTAGTGAALLANLGCGSVASEPPLPPGGGITIDDAGSDGALGRHAEDGGPMGKVAEDAGDDSGFVGDRVDDAGPLGLFVDAGLTIDDAGTPSDAGEAADVILLGTAPFTGGDAGH